MEVTVDYEEVTDALTELANTLNNEVAQELNKVSSDIVKEAQSVHRFKSRTGNLIRSTKKQLGIDKNSVSAIFKIDDLKAPYGGYVHDGHGKWAADPFLEDAVTRNEDELVKATESGVNKAINKAGF